MIKGHPNKGHPTKGFKPQEDNTHAEPKIEKADEIQAEESRKPEKGYGNGKKQAKGPKKPVLSGETVVNRTIINAKS